MFMAVSLLPIGILCAAWAAWAIADPPSALAAVLPSERTSLLLANSLVLAAMVALLATALGGCLAIWLEGGDGTLRGWVRRLYLLPLLIPPYIHALSWMSVSGRRQLLEQVAAILVGPNRLQVPTYGLWPTALVMTFSLYPVVTTLVLSGIKAIDPETMEQALLLGSAWRCATRVLLPLLAPWILAGAGIAFVLTIVEYGVPSALQYNNQVMEVYATFSQSGNPLEAMAPSVPLVVAAVALLAASQAALPSNRMRGTAERRPPIAIAFWPKAARAALLASVGLALVSSVGPVAILASRVGFPGPPPSALASASSDLLRTVAIALAAATVSTAIAVPTALAVVKASRRSALLWIVCTIPLAIPSPITGIAMVHLGNHPWLDWSQQTVLPIVWAHAARMLPFGVFAASTQIRRIDPLLCDALHMHRVGVLAALRQVHLPLLAPALWKSWLLVFVLSLGELGSTLLVCPPGQGTLPLRIYNLMHYGAGDAVAALALALLGIAGITSALTLGIGRRVWRWTL